MGFGRSSKNGYKNGLHFVINLFWLMSHLETKLKAERVATGRNRWNRVRKDTSELNKYSGEYKTTSMNYTQSC
ncbi:unnamed protein product [Hermetia illucens]|uniref:Uncharacterized protein n=1 Tax=Hermetia illucens TaxID=343691 RepID=A0A7R8UHS7_HERIL|nr:unnamed protein product [Hermetia illucens]